MNQGLVLIKVVNGAPMVTPDPLLDTQKSPRPEPEAFLGFPERGSNPRQSGRTGYRLLLYH